MEQRNRKLERSFGRRDLLRAAGGVSLAGITCLGETIDAATQKVNTRSRPSDLKITDLRVAWVDGAPMSCPVLRIDTNQGISGYGEVRDGASPTYALILKSRILGENPCNVEKIFRKIRQFGHHGRQGGGVSGVEMALWDLCGKAYNVPGYQLLGGKYRDKIRLYADTAESHDPRVYGERLKKRAEQGYSFLKMDLGCDLVEGTPGTITRPLGSTLRGNDLVPHMFTAWELTDKGIAMMSDYVRQIREVVGMELPLAADHFGHIGVNSCIRLGKALEKYNMAWLEDMIPWQYADLMRKITDELDVPILTGEDIYLREEFIKLASMHAVDIVHPDLATAGGMLETKRIGDACQEYGVPMAMHFAGTPVSFMANIHCAAATEGFLVLENHSVDVPWWEDMVTGIDKPIVDKGLVTVPERPGLGIELNEEVVRKHLRPGTEYFAPTQEWNRERSWDRLWS